MMGFYPVSTDGCKTAAGLLEQLLGVERETRADRSHQTLMKMAILPAMKTFDYYVTFASAAPLVQFQELAGLIFLDRTENVMLTPKAQAAQTVK